MLNNKIKREIDNIKLGQFADYNEGIIEGLRIALDIIKKQNTIYVAQMCWPEREVPVAASYSKTGLKADAVEILRKEYGTGDIERPGAMCSLPISKYDIEIVEIPCSSD